MAGESAINGQSAAVLDASGDLVWSKNPDMLAQGKSTIKLISCAIFRDILTDLDQLLTVSSAENYRAGIINVGQSASLADHIYAAVFISDGRAILTMQRYALAALGTDNAGLYAYMENWLTTNCGWSGHTIDDAGGFGINTRFSARNLAQFHHWLKDGDPWLYGAAGALTRERTLDIVGGDPITIEHVAVTGGLSTVIPEFIQGKGGSSGSLPTSELNYGLTWRHPDGDDYALGITMTLQQNRDADLRTILTDLGADGTPYPFTPAPTINRRRGAIAAL